MEAPANPRAPPDDAQPGSGVLSRPRLSGRNTPEVQPHGPDLVVRHQPRALPGHEGVDQGAVGAVAGAQRLEEVALAPRADPGPRQVLRGGEVGRRAGHVAAGEARTV